MTEWPIEFEEPIGGEVDRNIGHYQVALSRPIYRKRRSTLPLHFALLAFLL
jgi:hypothetical protein